jgi:hypothetical protein
VLVCIHEFVFILEILSNSDLVQSTIPALQLKIKHSADTVTCDSIQVLAAIPSEIPSHPSERKIQRLKSTVTFLSTFPHTTQVTQPRCRSHLPLSPHPPTSQNPKKLGDSPANLLINQGGYGHITRAPPGVSLPSGSRTRNLQILDPAFKPLRCSGDTVADAGRPWPPSAARTAAARQQRRQRFHARDTPTPAARAPPQTRSSQLMYTRC